MKFYEDFHLGLRLSPMEEKIQVQTMKGHSFGHHLTANTLFMFEWGQPSGNLHLRVAGTKYGNNAAPFLVQ